MKTSVIILLTIFAALIFLLGFGLGAGYYSFKYDESVKESNRQLDLKDRIIADHNDNINSIKAGFAPTEIKYNKKITILKANISKAKSNLADSSEFWCKCYKQLGITNPEIVVFGSITSNHVEDRVLFAELKVDKIIKGEPVLKDGSLRMTFRVQSDIPHHKGSFGMWSLEPTGEVGLYRALMHVWARSVEELDRMIKNGKLHGWKNGFNPRVESELPKKKKVPYALQIMQNRSVTLTFKSTSMENALDFLRDITNLKIVVSEAAKKVVEESTVHLILKDILLKVAIELLLEDAGLDYEIEGKTIRIILKNR